MLDAALLYAQNGWAVFPLHSPQGEGCSCGKSECNKAGKHPRVANWQNDASSDVETLTKWWTQWPDANIGVRLDGLAVLDVDPRHAGDDSLAALEVERPSDESITLYAHTRQRTGGAGMHYVYRAGDETKPVRGFRPGLDYLTGAGCYIVAAPSLHASGARYQWVEQNHPLDSSRESIALTRPPRWLLDAVAGKKQKLHKGRSPSKHVKSFNLPDEIGEGQRDVTLTRLAGKMRRAALGEVEILAALRQVNQERCKPPLPDSDLQRIAHSIGKKQPAPADEDAGMTKALADAILVDAHFARDAGGRLYHFSGGVYAPTGERFIAQRVKALCDAWQKTKSWSPELATRVAEWIGVDAPELWECPPLDVLNCKNGLLDIGTRTLGPHSHDYVSPIQIPVNYDPGAKCPAIEQFVADVFPEDSQHLTWEICAWLILPNTNLQKAILLLGEGSNGKSAWLNLIQELLGRGNVSAVSLHKLESDKFALARLLGKLANICADLPTAALSGTSMFKALSGNDLVNAERKYEASFEFRPFARLLFSANSAPRSEDSTHGFFRRWLCIPFNRTFDETDPNTIPPEILKARLCHPAELSGLLNKALDALPAIRTGRFTESASTRAALNDFRQTTDPLAVWLDQNTVERPDAVIPKHELRAAYARVCQDKGMPIMQEVQFTSAMKRLRPRVEPALRRVDGRPTRVFVGLGFMTLDQGPVGALGF